MNSISRNKNCCGLSQTALGAGKVVGVTVYFITLIAIGILQKNGKIPHFHTDKNINALFSLGIAGGTSLISSIAVIALVQICQIEDSELEEIDEQFVRNQHPNTQTINRTKPNKQVFLNKNNSFNTWLKQAFQSKKNTQALVSQGNTIRDHLENGQKWVKRKQQAFLTGSPKIIQHDVHVIHHDLKKDLTESEQLVARMQPQASLFSSTDVVINYRNVLFDPYSYGYYFNIDEVIPPFTYISYEIWNGFLNDLSGIPQNDTFKGQDIRDAVSACQNKASDDKTKKRILYLYYLIKQNNDLDNLGIFICQLAGVTTEARCADGLQDALLLLEKRIVLNSIDSEPSFAEKVSLTLIYQQKTNFLNGYKDPRYTDERYSAAQYQAYLDIELIANEHFLKYDNTYESTFKSCKYRAASAAKQLRSKYEETHNNVALIFNERAREVFNLPGSFQPVVHPSYNAVKYQYLGIKPSDFEPTVALERFFLGGDLVYAKGNPSQDPFNPQLTATIPHEAITAESLIETMTDQIYFLPEGYHHSGVYISPADIQAFFGAHLEDPALGKEIRECYVIGMKQVEEEELSASEKAKFDNPEINKYFNSSMQPSDREQAKNIVKEILLALGYIQHK